MDRKIGIIVGSIRKDAHTKKLADFLISNTPLGYQFEIITIDDLPLYNQDYDEANDQQPTLFSEKKLRVWKELFL